MQGSIKPSCLSVSRASPRLLPLNPVLGALPDGINIIESSTKPSKTY